MYLLNRRKSFRDSFVAGTYNTLLLNGTSQYLSFGNPSELQLVDGISICAWFRTSDMSLASNKFNPIVSRRTTSFLDWQLTHVLTNDGSAHKIRFDHNGSSQETTATVSTADTWYHLAMTYDESNVKFYINGSLDSTTASTTALTTSANGVFIGFDNIGVSSSYLDGNLSSVLICNSALSGTNITEIYNSGVPLHTQNYSSGIKSTYAIAMPLNDGVDSPFNDYSGNGLNPTLNGSPTMSTPTLTYG